MNTHYWALQRSIEKHASRSPKRGGDLKQLEDMQVRRSHQLKSQMPVIGQVHFEETNIVRESIGSTRIQRAPHHFESTHLPND